MHITVINNLNSRPARANIHTTKGKGKGMKKYKISDREVLKMRRTNRVYLVTWSYPGGAWNVSRAYVDTKAQARKASKNQFGSNIEFHEIELWEE